jgi:HD domain-containing protein
MIAASTNVRLYRQVREKGYCGADLERVHQAYDLAAKLCAGRVQRNTALFLDHLVGVASILVTLEMSPDAVCAGLLHSAYLNGDFGDGVATLCRDLFDLGRDRASDEHRLYLDGEAGPWFGSSRLGMRLRLASRAKRLRVRAAIGPVAESYVFRFTAMRWQDDLFPVLSAALDGFDAVDREVVAIRLANELEHLVGRGVLYGTGAQRQLAFLLRNRDLFVTMARELGLERLADELSAGIDMAAEGIIPVELLCAREGPATSFLLPPPSSRPRLSALLRGWVVHCLDQLPRIRSSRMRSVR